jgi:hypothetical protein
LKAIAWEVLQRTTPARRRVESNLFITYSLTFSETMSGIF